MIYGIFYRRKIKKILNNDELSLEQQNDKIEEIEYKEGKRIAIIISRMIAVLYLIDVLYFVVLYFVGVPKVPNAFFNIIAACYLFPCALFLYIVNVIII